MAPATRSLAPLIYLVMEYTTTSAPSRAGEIIMGVKVLSDDQRQIVGVGQAGQCTDVGYLSDVGLPRASV